MSDASSMSSNGAFLASTRHISEAASIAFVVVFGIFTIGAAVKLVRATTNKLQHGMLALLCAVRVGTYVTRAYVASRDTVQDPPSKGAIIAAGVLLIAGYLFFLEAVTGLILSWISVIRNVNLTSGAQIRGKSLQHLVLSAISIIGIVGAINQSNATTLDQFNSAKHLRLVSGILFVVVAVLLVVAVFVVGVTTGARQSSSSSSGNAKQNLPMPVVSDRSVDRSAWSFLFLALLASCTVVESVYRIWSAISTSGFIVEEAAVDVLVFLPEALAMIAWLLVDTDDLTQLRWAWSRQSRR